MRSAKSHAFVVACTVLLFGGMWSPGGTQKVSMTYEQNVQSQEHATRATIESFNEVFNRQDADGLAAVLTDDTVFEDTSPAPDGRRVEGKPAVVEFWRGWFTRNSDAQFD